MVLDAAYLIDALKQAGHQGVKMSLDIVSDRAKELAPVRDIFRHGRGRSKKSSVHTMKASDLGGSPNTMSGQQVGTSHLPSHTGRQVIQGINPDRAFIGGPRAIVRKGSSDNPLTGKPVSTVEKLGGTIRGRVNSYGAVVKTPGGYIGGEELRYWGGPGVLEIKQIRGPKGSFKLEDLLSSRGRWELKSERAVVTTTGKHGTVQTVGGRLREGIKVEGPFENGDEVYGFVSASASDPGSTHNYAKDQEFGSRHNRPHSFLRPALRQSHKQIIDLKSGALKRAISGGTRPAPGAGQATRPIVIKTKVSITGFTEAVEQVHSLVSSLD